MTRPVADLVKHLWTNTGNGSPIDLGAAAPGFFPFPSTLNNQIISYSIEHANGAERETGIGTYTHTPPRLTRSFVTQSTAGAPTKQSFTAGTKHVRLTALGLDVVENRAITNPGINDDISVGYIEGRSRWLNYQSKQLFFCVDHTVGAARWLQVMAPPFDAGEFDPAAIDLSRGQLEYDSYTQIGAITASLASGLTPSPGGSVAVNIIGGGFAFNFASPFVGLDGLTSGAILESGTSYPFFIRFAPDWTETSPGVFVDRVLVGAIGFGTGGGGGLVPTSVKTSAYTAVPGELVRTNSSGGGFNVTLPLDPPDGAYVSLLDVAIGGSWVANPVTVLRNGAAIGGVLDDVILDVDVRQLDLVYGAVADDWVPSFTSAFAVAEPPPASLVLPIILIDDAPADLTHVGPDKIVVTDTGDPVTLTLQPFATSGIPRYSIINLDRRGNGSFTVEAAGGVVLAHAPDRLPSLRSPKSSAVLYHDPLNTWQLRGELSAV